MKEGLPETVGLLVLGEKKGGKAEEEEDEEGRLSAAIIAGFESRRG